MGQPRALGELKKTQSSLVPLFREMSRANLEIRSRRKETFTLHLARALLHFCFAGWNTC